MPFWLAHEHLSVTSAWVSLLMIISISNHGSCKSSINAVFSLACFSGETQRRGESHAGKINVMKDVELYRRSRSSNSIILKQVNASVAGKKKKTIRWWSYVNFHLMQFCLVMIMRFIFGDDWNNTPCWSRFAEESMFYGRFTLLYVFNL